MKKLCAAVFCLAVLFFGLSIAECTDGAFEKAKQCVERMGNGDLQGAANAVGMSEEQLEEALSVLNAYPQKTQTTYAVSWEENGMFFLAVPLQEPADGFIDTAVFTLSSDEVFRMLVFQKWSEVLKRCEKTASMRWNVAYSPDFIILSD